MTSEKDTILPAKARPTSHNPFTDFQPAVWMPSKIESETGRQIYSIRRNHGVNGQYKLHNLNDAINDDKPLYDKVLVEYVINDCHYPIFTVGNLLSQTYPIDSNGEGNILGDLAERISRRITKYFLQHWDKRGKMGGIFDQRFDPQNRDDFIVANTSDYILKILRYPNLIILKRSKRGKFGYENIKELDGFFDYRFMSKRHILVLESKLEKINVDCNDLINNLFNPLRQLFPEAQFHYILFTDKYSVYNRAKTNRFRQIKEVPIMIYERLKKEGVGSLFFTFNEGREDFEKIKNFLIVQYRAIKKMSFTIIGKTVLSEKELMVFDGGETPHIKLIKDPVSGFWKEVPLRHKK
jgi:hypothetical protein